MESSTQPQLTLAYESITFTRSDGKQTTIDLLTDVLDSGDASGAILWAVLMKLQGVMEFQQIMAEQNVKLMEAQASVAVSLGALVERANQPIQLPELPDYDQIIGDVFEKMGLPKDTLAKAMASMTPPGVSISKPNGDGSEA